MSNYNVIDINKLRLIGQTRAYLEDSLLAFIKTMYKARTGRDFELSHPIGRESHFITITNALEKVFHGKTKRLIINVPPRYGKTEMLIHFVAWALAQCPASNFMYVSYSHSLAKKQSQTVREIITMIEYKEIFNVGLKEDTTAKDNFETKSGGSVYAVGAGGTIVGRGAGIKGTDSFGGCIVIDDIHKPDEATSDVIREGVIEWYHNSLQTRLNSPRTPIILIGQCTHEHDLSKFLREQEGWEKVIIPAIDEAGNALYPEMHDLKALQKMQKESPYEFAAQYQQNPQPAGGGIFKPEWFDCIEYEPEIVQTFITCDTAESDKDYNDPSVFSFWGLYKIVEKNLQLDIDALHWIDCVEIRVEPKDLENAFLSFWHQCMQHKVKPEFVAVEKKSTGVTLASLLKQYRGMRTIDIERTKASGSKTARFLEMQTYVAQKRITLPLYGKHTKMCIEHMRKITANNSHRFDDIADTAYDAVKISLIDQFRLGNNPHSLHAYNDPRVRAVTEKVRNWDRLQGNRLVLPTRSPF